MRSIQHLPDDVKKTFGFKLTVYILPGIIFALISALLIIPAPKPKQGVLQGHVNSLSSASSTLVAEPASKKLSPVEITLIPGEDYKLNIPAGEYKLRLKDDLLKSPQLPRNLTIVPNSSAIFDITLD